MPLKILAAADLHLGRRPSRLPSELTDRIAARELGPAGAWERLVDLAVDEKVDALLLAGDVVEAEDDFFEAYAELHRGVTRLAEAGVRVFAVAGNHDTRVLPYLSDEVEAFELLGRGGEWESVHLEANGEKATLWGWSFPQASVREDPVSGLSFSRGPGPNLGLLHCDRDQVGSSYAPVSSRSLEAAGLDAWLLGHIHAPDGLSLSRPTGYLGSLTGLDPGEPGPRGAWLLTIDQGTLTEFRRVALAPLRWVRLEVSLDGLDEPEEARRRALDSYMRTFPPGQAQLVREPGGGPASGSAGGSYFGPGGRSPPTLSGPADSELPLHFSPGRGPPGRPGGRHRRSGSRLRAPPCPSAGHRGTRVSPSRSRWLRG